MLGKTALSLLALSGALAFAWGSAAPLQVHATPGGAIEGGGLVDSDEPLVQVQQSQAVGVHGAMAGANRKDSALGNSARQAGSWCLPPGTRW